MADVDRAEEMISAPTTPIQEVQLRESRVEIKRIHLNL